MGGREDDRTIAVGFAALEAFAEALADAARIGEALERDGLRPGIGLSIGTTAGGGRIIIQVFAQDGSGGRREYAQCIRDWRTT